MKELAYFIQTTYHKLHSLIDQSTPLLITFILGNTSCDMDSVLSSILVSFLKNVECGFIQKKPESEEILFNIDNKEKKLYLPVINCKKGECFWRLDIKELLTKYEISEYEFYYFEDIFNSSSQSIEFKSINCSNEVQHKYEICLVDHYELSHDQQCLKSYITQIIDHHDDTGFNYSSNYHNLKNKKVLFPRSSCLSIILEDLFENQMYSKIFSDNNCYDMIISAQLLDSSGFKDSKFNIKWVKEDQMLVYKVLEHYKTSVFLSSKDNEEWNKMDKEDLIKHLANHLKKSKKHLEKNLELGLYCIFNKDRKDFQIKSHGINIIYCCLPIPYDSIVKRFSKNSVKELIEDVCNKDNIDLFIFRYETKEENVIAHFVSSSGDKKPILSIKVIKSYFNELKNSNQFKVKEYELDKDEMHFVYGGKGLSRKLIWPFMKHYFDNIKLNCSIS